VEHGFPKVVVIVVVAIVVLVVLVIVVVDDVVVVIVVLVVMCAVVVVRLLVHVIDTGTCSTNVSPLCTALACLISVLSSTIKWEGPATK